MKLPHSTLWWPGRQVLSTSWFAPRQSIHVQTGLASCLSARPTPLLSWEKRARSSSFHLGSRHALLTISHTELLPRTNSPDILLGCLDWIHAGESDRIWPCSMYVEHDKSSATAIFQNHGNAVFLWLQALLSYTQVSALVSFFPIGLYILWVSLGASSWLRAHCTWLPAVHFSFHDQMHGLQRKPEFEVSWTSPVELTYSKGMTYNWWPPLNIWECCLPGWLSILSLPNRAPSDVGRTAAWNEDGKRIGWCSADPHPWWGKLGVMCMGISSSQSLQLSSSTITSERVAWKAALHASWSPASDWH